MATDPQNASPTLQPPAEHAISANGGEAQRIARALGRINDPAFSYFVSMALDRAAEIATGRRADLSPSDTMALALSLAAEPHGVPYAAHVPGEAKS